MIQTWFRGNAAIALAVAVVALMLTVLALEMTGSKRLSLRADVFGRPLMAEQVGSSAAARPSTVIKPIACQQLPNVPGKSITTVLVEYPPNAFTPAHRHPGSVTAHVTRGRIRSQLNADPARVYGPGESWFEPPGTRHSFAENASGTEPAELLAIFVADDNCGPLVIYER